ncbi:cytochrome c biogenesis heme-transporting ATPase CcmA [Candidatus Thiosymbion oneisti]|uniref:cytochrome c biogenesis heme-transporting ATPase CcmA n=1 Tax=Candidatus Thiosymbion oneisti TaxID=589554 RepID=UPI000A4E8866|nr:cytochrome c biogenesis heme-transporting ATPase CcmA [Candidatus Thiosymbion oneisti]
MLKVVDLACRRGDRRLFSGVSFALEPGTLLHVRGRNGSGKTTLLRALCGLLVPEAGEIRWQGKDSRHLGEDYHADLLYCGHLNGIKGDLTGIENLRVAAILDGNPVDEGRLWSALEQMGLAGYEDLPAMALSQGQKRRVALARLLVSKAPLWILDEPFITLDTDAVDLLLRLIAGHVADGGIVILTTHQEVPLTSGQVQQLDLGDEPLDRCSL